MDTLLVPFSCFCHSSCKGDIVLDYINYCVKKLFAYEVE
jgi:hypothetical protein